MNNVSINKIFEKYPLNLYKKLILSELSIKRYNVFYVILHFGSKNQKKKYINKIVPFLDFVLIFVTSS